VVDNEVVVAAVVVGPVVVGVGPAMGLIAHRATIPARAIPSRFRIIELLISSQP
jgi:hypothetical protein